MNTRSRTKSARPGNPLSDGNEQGGRNDIQANMTGTNPKNQGEAEKGTVQENKKDPKDSKTVTALEECFEKCEAYRKNLANYKKQVTQLTEELKMQKEQAEKTRRAYEANFKIVTRDLKTRNDTILQLEKDVMKLKTNMNALQDYIENGSSASDSSQISSDEDTGGDDGEEGHEEEDVVDQEEMRQRREERLMQMELYEENVGLRAKVHAMQADIAEAVQCFIAYEAQLKEYEQTMEKLKKEESKEGGHADEGVKWESVYSVEASQKLERCFLTKKPAKAVYNYGKSLLLAACVLMLNSAVFGKRVYNMLNGDFEPSEALRNALSGPNFVICGINLSSVAKRFKANVMFTYPILKITNGRNLYKISMGNLVNIVCQCKKVVLTDEGIEVFLKICIATTCPVCSTNMENLDMFLWALTFPRTNVVKGLVCKDGFIVGANSNSARLRNTTKFMMEAFIDDGKKGKINPVKIYGNSEGMIELPTSSKTTNSTLIEVVTNQKGAKAVDYILIDRN